MGYDPSGNFTRAHNWQQDRNNGIRILADRHDEEDNNFANAFNQVFLRNGAVPLTGDLNMGGKKITTIAAGTELLPGLTFELSTATGLYQANPNHIGFSINGTKRLELLATGAVVNGNAVLNGPAGTNPKIEINAPAGAFYSSLYFQQAGVNKAYIMTFTDGHLYYNIPGVFNHIFQAGGATAMTVKQTGVDVAGILTNTGSASLATAGGTANVNIGGAGTGVGKVTFLTNAGAAGYIIQSTAAGGYHDAGVTTFRNLAGSSIWGTIGANITFGPPVATAGTQGLMQIAATNTDPAVTPAVLDVQKVSPSAGSSVVPEYVAKFSGVGSNQSSLFYGVHASVNSNVQFPTCGVFGESQLASSNCIHRGVWGKSVYHSDGIYGTGLMAGVYGEVVLGAGGGHTSVSYAGCFEHKGTKGNYSIAVYCSTVAGSTNAEALRCDHNGSSILIAHPAGVNVVTGVTASAGNLYTATTTVSQILRSSSALRYKRDVAPIGMAEALKLRTVQPIQFKSRSSNDNPDTIFYGFIAEEVAQAGLEPLVHYAFQEDQVHQIPDKDFGKGHFKTVPKKGELPRPDGIQYERIVVLQQLLINDLMERVAALEGA